MPEYPIPVEDFTGSQALTIVCEKCGAEEVIHPDDILNDDLYMCPADAEKSKRASTEARCYGFACMKYMVADKCKGCGDLGWFSDLLDHCCSRRCQLQAEYAETIAITTTRGDETR